jgi:hypothetical protein
MVSLAMFRSLGLIKSINLEVNLYLDSKKFIPSKSIVATILEIIQISSFWRFEDFISSVIQFEA